MENKTATMEITLNRTKQDVINLRKRLDDVLLENDHLQQKIKESNDLLDHQTHEFEKERQTHYEVLRKLDKTVKIKDTFHKDLAAEKCDNFKFEQQVNNLKLDVTNKDLLIDKLQKDLAAMNVVNSTIDLKKAQIAELDLELKNLKSKRRKNKYSIENSELISAKKKVKLLEAAKQKKKSEKKKSTK